MKLLKAVVVLIVFFFGGLGHYGLARQQTQESDSHARLRG